MERGTSTDHVDAVLAIDDRVLRNYWVTQSYADLAAGLSALLGPDTANWCTFGTWASCTVGRNLRGEDLPDWLHQRVVLSDGMMGATREVNQALGRVHPDRAFYEIVPEHVSEVVRELFGACATNLSDGNTEVFAEIAPAAATFITCFESGPVEPSSARANVLRLCERAPAFEGRNRLQAGFTHWCDAMSESDPVRRSQLILAGSIELGAHEQHHLQGPIAGSMDMGVNQSVERLMQRVVKDEPVPAAIVESVAALLYPLGRAFSDVWGALMTELLGTIQTPDGTLRLDRDVPPIPGKAFVPGDLEPIVIDDLATLLERFNRAERDGDGSRAIDWVSLDDRMNFISNLFRSRHHRTELFQPPFDSAVLAAIESQRIPDPAPRPSDHDPGGRDRPGAPVSGPGTPGGGAGQTPVVPPSKGTQLFTDPLIQELRLTGDQPADQAVSEFMDATGSEHAELFKRLAATSAESIADEDLPGIGPFVTREEDWPEWASPALVRDGQSVFGEFGPQLGMGLFMASLPADYAMSKGVQALARTARLTHNPKRRYVETGQMIIDVMTPGALQPGGPGYRTVRHVRLMHAAVRHVLQHLSEIQPEGAPPLEPWDAGLGVPINQLQLLGTLFSFGVQGVESLHRTGVRLTAYQTEAYIHVWNLVGHQLGIREDLLPLGWEDSEALWEKGKRREYGPTPEGRELTRAAIDCMRELFAFSHLPGLPATGIRHYLGDETADMLGVPKSDWTRVIFEVMSRTDWLYDFALIRLPYTGPIASALGRRVWRGFELYGRDGERPAFQVTDELKEAWGM
jgi:ER-bound oxygenase mpaB/B'/Rubber oxygenase, catalytic domain